MHRLDQMGQSVLWVLDVRGAPSRARGPARHLGVLPHEPIGGADGSGRGRQEAAQAPRPREALDTLGRARALPRS